MFEFIERNAMTWVATSQDEIAQTIEWLAAGDLAEADFITWVRARVHCP
jgi:hypothetical protein